MGRDRQDPAYKAAVGARVAGLRKSRGEAVGDAAASCAVTPGTWSNVEAGRSLPSVELILRISEHYGITTDWLLKGGGDDADQA